MKQRGNKGRGRRAVSAQRPKTPMIATVRKAVGMLRSWDLLIELRESLFQYMFKNLKEEVLT
jgi:hypothetical protein